MRQLAVPRELAGFRAALSTLKYPCREPFRKPSGWLTWGLVGVVLAPIVIGLTVTVMSYSGYEVQTVALLGCIAIMPRNL